MVRLIKEALCEPNHKAVEEAKRRKKREKKWKRMEAKRNRSVTETHSQRLITLSMKSQMQERAWEPAEGGREIEQEWREEHRHIKK